MAFYTEIKTDTENTPQRVAIASEDGYIGSNDITEKYGIYFTSTLCNYPHGNQAIKRSFPDVWMATNLRETHFANGDPIEWLAPSGIAKSSETPQNCEWEDTQNANPKKPYCSGWPFVENDFIFRGDLIATEIYGLLYNWYAVADIRRLAPDGWHIPGRHMKTIYHTSLSIYDTEVDPDYAGAEYIIGGSTTTSGSVGSGMEGWMPMTDNGVMWTSRGDTPGDVVSTPVIDGSGDIFFWDSGMARLAAWYWKGRGTDHKTDGTDGWNHTTVAEPVYAGHGESQRYWTNLGQVNAGHVNRTTEVVNKNYGLSVRCRKNPTCVDIDGNEYETVHVPGTDFVITQTNARVTKFNDGTDITLSPSGDAGWGTANGPLISLPGCESHSHGGKNFTPSITDYSRNLDYLGYLYNGFCWMPEKTYGKDIAPKGWRVATSQDFMKIFNAISHEAVNQSPIDILGTPPACTDFANWMFYSGNIILGTQGHGHGAMLGASDKFARDHGVWVGPYSGTSGYEMEDMNGHWNPRFKDGYDGQTSYKDWSDSIYSMVPEKNGWSGVHLSPAGQRTSAGVQKYLGLLASVATTSKTAATYYFESELAGGSGDGGLTDKYHIWNITNNTYVSELEFDASGPPAYDGKAENVHITEVEATDAGARNGYSLRFARDI